MQKLNTKLTPIKISRGFFNYQEEYDKISKYLAKAIRNRCDCKFQINWGKV